MSDVPKVLVFDARTAISFDGEQLNTSCKKREMKFEFRLLNDILDKTVIVKAGSFDAVTHERFLMMSAIHGGVKVNWDRLLFNIFKDMVTPATKQARGYAVQICILLKGAPDLKLGESKDFPHLKILTAKTVCTYVAKNQNITVDVDEPAGDEPVVKKKAASKRRPAPTVDVEPISTVPAVTPHASRRRTPKRKLVLQTGSDDEIVDSIIHQVIADTTAIETGEPDVEEQEEVQDQKAAMLAFREESQEHFSTLRDHLAEIIAYFNRGGDDKRGKVVAAKVHSHLRKIRADLVVVVVAEVNLQ
ncbi:hypothetical protein F511_29234 [Dorcoceras hygrometricum]|uniref:Uncharacterized protein n=1 Tax=Dorcoceras hygrometricum TaxID=472368 RepID=A0A2Z7DI82_9LAMI|nr:hypothetical protein F511_29234 [Dorcoceras hygrometricum]